MMTKVAMVSVLLSCALAMAQAPDEKSQPIKKTMAEELGYPADKRIVILHADDAGMSVEANEAIQKYLLAGEIQSTAVMMPCPAAAEMIKWAVQQKRFDVGIHTTLTSEWKTWRWATITPADQVKGLLDAEGFIWRTVEETASHALPSEISLEMHNQIKAAQALGWEPTHLDTHMGTVYSRPDFTRAYLDLAMEYTIPAMVPDPTGGLVEKFQKQGYPLSTEMVSLLSQYKQPRLDDFQSIATAASYEEKKKNFYEQVKSLKPGLSEIIFHPAVGSEQLKQITGSWQQRVWEAQMFSDIEVKGFLHKQDIVFTNWREVMQRYRSKK
jgi:chitin disaccharide deacetylase